MKSEWSIYQPAEVLIMSKQKIKLITRKYVHFSNNKGNSNSVDIYHPSCMKNSVATHFLSLVAFGPKTLTQLPGEL